MRRRRVIVGIAATVLVAGGAAAIGASRIPSVASKVKRLWTGPQPSDQQAWPNPGATLTPPAVAVPDGFGPLRVFIDPGHGAKNNTGNVSSYCRDEQDFTLALARDLARSLETHEAFQVKVSRQQDVLVSYPDRVREANAWKAHAFVSLHSDVRGHSDPWHPRPGLECPRSDDAPGFSVLWSDEGPLASRRRRLARVFARRMSETGFLAYDGTEYRDLYEQDELVPGVFVDRHVPGKRIYVLRKPRMPSIIVETHNAWDPREARRWELPATRTAFFSVVKASLLAFGRAGRSTEVGTKGPQ